MPKKQVLAQGVPPLAERTKQIEQEPLPSNIASLLDESASEIPDHPALVFIESGETLTYRLLKEKVDGLVSGLTAIGVHKGTHLGVMLPNVPEWPVTWLAIARIGAIAIPINTRYTARELHYVLDDAEAEYLIIHDSMRHLLTAIPQPLPRLTADKIIVVGDDPGSHRRWNELLTTPDVKVREMASVELDDMVNIQYTSGTTGFPKGCMLTQRYWLQLAKTQSACDGRSYRRMLASTPFFYMTPQWLVLMAFIQRGTLYVAARQSASKFAEWLHLYRINFCLFPTPAYKQPPQPYDRDNDVVRVSTYGFPKQSQADLEDRYDFVAREAFGMTEIGAGLFIPIEAEDMVGSGSCGVATPFRECRIADAQGNTLPRGEVGELLFRGPGMLLGYYRKPEATAAAFHGEWFRTGDLATQDKRGYIYIVGRIKDMIRRAGENVAAIEVEAVLASLPGIAEAAVVPVADDMRGEEIKAYIVLQPGHSRATLPPERIIGHCTANLASFKVPRYIQYRDAPLPRTASEKISKPTLLQEQKDLLADTWDRVEAHWR